MRIYAASDLHTDYRANRLLLEAVSSADYRADALLVAGDIADRLETIEETLRLLRARFSRLFYVPGNHELWVRDGRFDSLEKLEQVTRLCDRIGVETRPARAGGVWVVPLYSWYEAEFDEEPDEELEELEAWADFYFCRWPTKIGPIAAHFMSLNEARLHAYDAEVVTLSHFLPRRDLLPGRERLKFKGLPRVAGSEALDAQLRAINSRAHVFGHSHINCDLLIDGVRYVQNAMRYPAERMDLPFAFKQVWPFEEA